MIYDHKWRVLPDRETLEKKRLRERREKFVKMETMELAPDGHGICFPPRDWTKNLSEEDRQRRADARKIFQNARRYTPCRGAICRWATTHTASYVRRYTQIEILMTSSQEKVKSTNRS
ncbi:uncharacterized protein LOC34617300 [Cyclospora cayetanensis]|uniref:Uncharacterized protein LOC34617300 n=1 Tax=Cyclospora cayetanensis TaxID=88456 RepID=A0A6P6S3L2_9EIME|nr:uncharacterized protein LOC34617300 [Cyclospora cayetanensis]